MGKYFKHPQIISSFGRKLKGSFSYFGIARQLNDNEVIIGKYNKGILLCPIILNQQDFNTNEKGSYSCEYYAFDKNILDDTRYFE